MQEHEVLGSRRDDAGVLHYTGGVRFGLSGDDRAACAGFCRASSSRRRGARGLRFYRLLEGAVASDPHPDNALTSKSVA